MACRICLTVRTVMARSQFETPKGVNVMTENDETPSWSLIRFERPMPLTLRILLAQHLAA